METAVPDLSEERSSFMALKLQVTVFALLWTCPYLEYPSGRET
jgi:hypothetical protein